jgi:protein TonB
VASFRSLLPIAFTLGLHGALAGILLLLPERITSAANAVYQVSLADVAAAVGSGPPAREERLLPADVAAADPLPETSPAREEPPPPAAEERLISPHKAALSEKRREPPKRTPPRPRGEPPPVPAAPAREEGHAGDGDAGGGARDIGGLAAYNSEAVDQIPTITRKVVPDYPVRARRLELQGRVVVRLVVDAGGEPRMCAVYKADPPGYFEEAALDAARRTRFMPGKRRGRAVNTVVLLPFSFALR